MLRMTIGGKDCDINFGIAFVREADKKYNEIYDGKIKYGMGVSVLLSKILIGDVTALQELIYTGIEGKKPTQSEMDAFIDEHEDIDALFEEVLEELKKSNATRRQAANMVASMRASQTAESTTKS